MRFSYVQAVLDQHLLHSPPNTRALPRYKNKEFRDREAALPA